MNSPGFVFFALAGTPVLLTGIVYAAGARRRTDAGCPVHTLRHAAFAAGILSLFASVEWPFAQWAHELFYVHQIGMLVARIAAPMLIAISHPAGRLIAGLPRPIRASVLKPVISARHFRQPWRVIRRPVSIMLFYVATLYGWDIPAAQAAVLAYPAIGLVMHLTLLLAGLLFWTRIFERRPAPHGISHGQRLMMIWLAILTQIPLGAYITVKTTVLYPAYAASQRIAMVNPISDESRGGAMIWIVSGLFSLAALITVIDMWARHETRMDARRTRWSPSNSAILLYPTTARELRAMSRDKNRRLAVGLTAFVLIIFTAMCGFVAGAHRINRRENIRLYQLSKL